MLRVVLPSLLTVIAATAGAERACSIGDGQRECIRLLACVGERGIWFDGWSHGYGAGVLEGWTSDGASCQGTWQDRNVMGLGQADVACDDGRTGTVFYTLQDNETGTAIGTGQFDTGEWVRAWSGAHVLEFLSSETNGIPALPCPEGEIPIS